MHNPQPPQNSAHGRSAAAASTRAASKRSKQPASGSRGRGARLNVRGQQDPHDPRLAVARLDPHHLHPIALALGVLLGPGEGFHHRWKHGQHCARNDGEALAAEAHEVARELVFPEPLGLGSACGRREGSCGR